MQLQIFIQCFFYFTNLDVELEPELKMDHETLSAMETDSDPNHILVEHNKTDITFFFANTGGRGKEVIHKALLLSEETSNKESNETARYIRAISEIPRNKFQSYDSRFPFLIFF